MNGLLLLLRWVYTKHLHDLPKAETQEGSNVWTPPSFMRWSKGPVFAFILAQQTFSGNGGSVEQTEYTILH